MKRVLEVSSRALRTRNTWAMEGVGQQCMPRTVTKRTKTRVGPGKCGFDLSDREVFKESIPLISGRTSDSKEVFPIQELIQT